VKARHANRGAQQAKSAFRKRRTRSARHKYYLKRLEEDRADFDMQGYGRPPENDDHDRVNSTRPSPSVSPATTTSTSRPRDDHQGRCGMNGNEDRLRCDACGATPLRGIEADDSTDASSAISSAATAQHATTTN